jgi:deazaflavin-dependent oxidoreductase (nitroreductase family)
MNDSSKPRPIDPRMSGIFRVFMKLFTRLNVAVYRASSGRLMNRAFGSPICLVTMTGRRSGRKLTIPLIHIPIGKDVLLVASQAGLDTHPVWFHNISANPEIGITAGGETRRMRARRASSAEKAALWPVAVAVYADFDQYQARTERDIPLLICSPV